MLPNGRTLLIVSFVCAASNWQFGYQITYINTAATGAAGFYALANDAHQHEQRSVSGRAKQPADLSLSYAQWSQEWSIAVAR